MTTEPFKIYPSSAAFMPGPLVKTSSNKSCHRYLWAQAHSGLTKAELNQPIAAEYAAIGALDEYRFSVTLSKDKTAFQREVPFKIEYKGAVISGRQDFVLGDGVIIEKKSTTSEHVYKRVFVQGEPEDSHMAQLVSYLAFLKQPKGRIVVSYYELELSGEDQGFKMVEEKIFDVECLDSGRIMLGQEEYKYTVRDLARWYAELEKSLSNPSALPNKPCQTESKYTSPCYYCPFNKFCDETADVAQYLLKAKEALLVKPEPRAFKIKVLTDRRKKNRQDKKEKQNV